MEKLYARLDEVINYVRPLLPLANSHMVNFITHRLWDYHFPDVIREELRDKEVDEVLDIFWSHGKDENICDKDSAISKFLNETTEMSLNSKDGIHLSIEEFKDKITHWGTHCYGCPPLDQFMSQKKTHEVQVMSYLIASLTSLTGASHIIDIGGGKGYLSSILAFEYHLKVLGLDSCDIRTTGAAKRATKLQKVWQGVRKQYQPIVEENASQKEKPSSDDCNNLVDSKKDNNLYKQSVEFVKEDTNIMDLVVKTFSEDSEFKPGLVGLHTCGHLAPVCFRQFVSNSQMEYLVNVGCCYHLLEEWSSGSSQLNPIYGFPLSKYLREKNFSLGRNARMLSLQAKSKVSSLEKVPSESLMYRAVLQQLLVQKLGHSGIPRGQVGRLAEKCSSFPEYVQKALNKLGLHYLNVTDVEADAIYKRYEFWTPKLQIYFMLRVFLAPVLENIIILDRLLYLKEQGINHSYIVKMFDPVISPRCYGIVGIRDMSNSLKDIPPIS